jgi:hypothetical protein
LTTPATMNGPALPAWLHFARVTYACTFAATPNSTGTVTFASPAPVQFVFSFETGSTQPDPNTDLHDISFDYSWFDQAAVEAGITSALGTICTAISALLGVAAAVIEATVRIERVWDVAANQQGAAAPDQLGVAGSAGTSVTEVMPYVPS